MRRRTTSGIAVAAIAAAIALIAPTPAMAANASGTGYTCTPSSTGYYAHVRSTSKGWVVHETHGTYTQRVVGYKSAYTYADTGHRVSSISNWSVTATDYAGVAGAIKAGSASSGCGPY